MKPLNNKGQVLIIFIALIPILIAVLTITTDLSLITYNKKKLNSINKTALNYVKQNKDDYNKDIITKIISDNDKDINIVKLEDKENEVRLILSKSTNTIFGNIIGIKTYNITSKYMFNKQTNKITNIKE